MMLTVELLSAGLPRLDLLIGAEKIITRNECISVETRAVQVSQGLVASYWEHTREHEIPQKRGKVEQDKCCTRGSGAL